MNTETRFPQLDRLTDDPASRPREYAARTFKPRHYRPRAPAEDLVPVDRMGEADGNTD